MRVMSITGLFLILSVAKLGMPFGTKEDDHHYTVNYCVNEKYNTELENENGDVFKAFETKHVAWCEGRLESYTKMGNTANCDLKQTGTDGKCSPETEKFQVELEIVFPASINVQDLPSGTKIKEILRDTTASPPAPSNVDVNTISLSEDPTETLSKVYKIDCWVHNADSQGTTQTDVEDWCRKACSGLDNFKDCKNVVIGEENGNTTASFDVIFTGLQDETKVKEALDKTTQFTVKKIEKATLATGSTVAPSTTKKTNSGSSNIAAASHTTGVLSHKITLPSAFCLIALSWLMTRQHCG